MTHCAGQNGEKALSFDFSLSSEETELLEKEFGSVNIRQAVWLARLEAGAELRLYWRMEGSRFICDDPRLRKIGRPISGEKMMLDKALEADIRRLEIARKAFFEECRLNCIEMRNEKMFFESLRF